MPTNANTFNSRVTSEALEKKFRDVFPAQGGAELVQDLFASGVIQPVIDFSSVAEGSVLPANLQTAWDFSTGHNTVSNTTTTVINNTGFWRVDLNCNLWTADSPQRNANVAITDGLTSKVIWEVNSDTSTSTRSRQYVHENAFVVFLRSGDSLTATSNAASVVMDIWYRQIADVSGNLVNPLGFTSS